MAQPTCRGCGAPVVWITSPKGRPMICDARVRSEWILLTSLADDVEKKTLPRIALTTSSGQVVAGYIVGEGDSRARATLGRESHFGSCPNRQTFRKARA